MSRKDCRARPRHTLRHLPRLFATPLTTAASPARRPPTTTAAGAVAEQLVHRLREVGDLGSGHERAPSRRLPWMRQAPFAEQVRAQPLDEHGRLAPPEPVSRGDTPCKNWPTRPPTGTASETAEIPAPEPHAADRPGHLRRSSAALRMARLSPSAARTSCRFASTVRGRVPRRATPRLATMRMSAGTANSRCAPSILRESMSTTA